MTDTLSFDADDLYFPSDKPALSHHYNHGWKQTETYMTWSNSIVTSESGLPSYLCSGLTWSIINPYDNLKLTFDST